MDVTLDGRVAELLVAGHLDQLWSADQDEGCCSTCCGPCWALHELLSRGQLDDLVRGYAAGSSWWVNDHVDRKFLTRAWRLISCHRP